MRMHVLRLRHSRARARGFTLVELAIVVVVVGILATIGGVVYTRHRQTVRSAEAKQMTADIRAAQEAYRQEKGVYANISADTSSFYPAPNPSNFVTEWGGPCGNCASGPESWRQLTVHPSSPVMYGYATIAGFGGAAVAPPPKFFAAVPPVPGAGAGGGGLAATDPFYVTVAWGDTNGDGDAAVIMSYSTSNALIVQGE